MVTALCRDCGALATSAARGERCSNCGSPRQVFHARTRHPVDSDAFYATIEKRDRPNLSERPVVICPDAVVIRPDMAKYREVGRAVRAAMLQLTPLVEPLSIDEAFLDLSGTEKLHGACPAQLLAALALRVEAELGLTVSIGLSDNKFLAKLASDLDKPRGFAVLSRSGASTFLADKPVSLLWGVGTAMQRRLAGDGITLIGQLAMLGERELDVRYGRIGARLARLARGEDSRAVNAHAPAHTISAENTLANDEADADALSHALWPLCERVSARLKQASLAAGTIHLEAQDRRFSLADALTPPRRPDPAGRNAVSQRRGPARQRSGRRQPVSADRGRGRRARREPYCRPADPVRPRNRPVAPTRTRNGSAPRETG